MIQFYETYASVEFLFSVVTQLQNDENQKTKHLLSVVSFVVLCQSKAVIDGNSKDMLS
jgi:hypothetical protein